MKKKIESGGKPERRKNVKPKRRRVRVEIGFGASTRALVLTAVMKPKAKVIGIEHNQFRESRIESAAEALREITKGKKQRLEDLKNLELLFLDHGAVEKLRTMPDNSVDVFRMDYVIDFIRFWGEREMLLKEIGRTLKSNGFFYVTLPLNKGGEGKIADAESRETYREIRGHLESHFDIVGERFLRERGHITLLQKSMLTARGENPVTAYLFVCRKKGRK